MIIIRLAICLILFMLHIFNLYINFIISFAKAIYCGLQPTNEKAMEKFNEMDWGYFNCMDYLFKKRIT